MKYGDFKKWAEAHGVTDDMNIILIDGTTDDTDDMNYFFDDKDLGVEDVYPIDGDYTDYPGIEEGEPVGKAVMIHFENKLNENNILLCSECHRYEWDHADNCPKKITV